MSHECSRMTAQYIVQLRHAWLHNHGVRPTTRIAELVHLRHRRNVTDTDCECDREINLIIYGTVTSDRTEQQCLQTPLEGRERPCNTSYYVFVPVADQDLSGPWGRFVLRAPFSQHYQKKLFNKVHHPIYFLTVQNLWTPIVTRTYQVY